MTINVPNPIADLRAASGYTVDELSLVSGLTVVEINKIETGELVDPARIARLYAAALGTAVAVAVPSNKPKVIENESTSS